MFGAVWVAARVSTDRNTRTVTCLGVDVTDAKFPNVDPRKIEQLRLVLEKEIPKWDVSMSLDQLLTMLELVEKEKAAAEDLKTTPPKIIFVSHPAVLVTIDGEPELREVAGSTLMRVVNTPFFIVFDPETKAHYLKGGDEWFTASDVMGPWEQTENPPVSVVALAADDSEAPAEDATETGDRSMPQIIVATEPTELIVADGDPKYTPIGGTELLFMSNTESDVFMEIGSQKYFVLLAGRWYTGASLSSEWLYVPSDKLPADFAKIPAWSAKGNVLAHVAGTKEAQDALHETYIPQTATIKRSDAKLSVEYDGAPKFEKIEDTEMYYAVNTSYSVIRVESSPAKYYCCNDAVWFVADNPHGPWVVCVSVPTVIYTIPPTCPHYHVKYVYVYDYTPDIVYVGYTPGYVGCYVHHGVVVYGTGYHYHGWHGRVYIARPATWGFAVRYNPHTGGWGFRVGHRGAVGWVGVGHVHVGGVHGGYVRGGWWGVGGYRGHRGYRRYGEVDIERSITTPRGSRSSEIEIDRGFGQTEIDISRERETRRGTLSSDTDIDIDRRSGDIDVDRNLDFQPNENVYDRRGDRARIPEAPSDRPGIPEDRKPPTTQQRQNNVFADRNGNVYRSTDTGGWQQRGQGGWASTSQQRPSPDLNRQHNARQRGSTRTSNYQRTRSVSTGGRRGGGRRR